MPQRQLSPIILCLALLGCTKMAEFAKDKRDENFNKTKESNLKLEQAERQAADLSKYADCVADAKNNTDMQKCEAVNPHAGESVKKSKSEADQDAWDKFSGKKTDVN